MRVPIILGLLLSLTACDSLPEVESSGPSSRGYVAPIRSLDDPRILDRRAYDADNSDFLAQFFR